MLSRAESTGFVEGAVWDEAHAGTNAPALRRRSTTQCRLTPPSILPATVLASHRPGYGLRACPTAAR